MTKDICNTFGIAIMSTFLKASNLKEIPQEWCPNWIYLWSMHIGVLKTVVYKWTLSNIQTCLVSMYVCTSKCLWACSGMSSIPKDNFSLKNQIIYTWLSKFCLTNFSIFFFFLSFFFFFKFLKVRVSEGI